MVSEAILLGACGEVAHHGRNHLGEKVAHFMETRMQKKEGVRVPVFPSKAQPPADLISYN